VLGQQCYVLSSVGSNKLFGSISYCFLHSFRQLLCIINSHDKIPSGVSESLNIAYIELGINWIAVLLS